VKYVNTYNDGNWLGNLYTFDGRVSTQVGDERTHTTIGTCLHSGKLTDNCDNCRHTPCNARIIVDPKEHKKHLGFCSQECFSAAQKDLFIKDVEWDKLPNNNEQIIKNKEGSLITYKELRSFVKNDKISLLEAQNLVANHFKKLIGKTTFPHQESQKEGVIDMD